jgi:hypothetical protein
VSVTNEKIVVKSPTIAEEVKEASHAITNPFNTAPKAPSS